MRHSCFAAVTDCNPAKTSIYEAMRNSNFFILILLSILVSGCANQIPNKTNIHLNVAPQKPDTFSSSTMISLGSIDERTNKDIIEYSMDSSAPYGLTNITPPHILLAEAISVGLQRQGLTVYKDAPLHIDVVIKKLLVQVTRPEIIYKSQLKCLVGVTIYNKRTTFSKNYDAEQIEETMRKPDIPFLEMMVTRQLNEITQQILSDQEITQVLKQ